MAVYTVWSTACGVRENSDRSDTEPDVLFLFSAMANMRPAKSPVKGSISTPPEDPFCEPIPCVDSMKNSLACCTIVSENKR